MATSGNAMDRSINPARKQKLCTVSICSDSIFIIFLSVLHYLNVLLGVVQERNATVTFHLCSRTVYGQAVGLLIELQHMVGGR